MTLAHLLAVALVVHGAWTMRRHVAIAERNRVRVESGRERYFEERRAWAAYGGTPLTDPAAVAKAGRGELLGGLALALLLLLDHWFDLDGTVSRFFSAFLHRN